MLIHSYYLAIFFVTVTTNVVGNSIGGFWVINDFHVNISYNFTKYPYGDSRFDSPILLYLETLKFCSRTHPEPNFIVLLGDFVAHMKGNETNGYYIFLNTLKMIVNVTRQYFPNTTIFPVIGNHDQYPVETIPDRSYYQNILTNANWDRLLKKDQAQQFLKGGYYFDDVATNIRLIVLNSVVFMTYFNGIMEQEDQLTWLSEQLKVAYKSNKTVIIVSHVPVGLGNDFTGNNITFLNSIYNEKLLKILSNKDSNPIQINLWAHQHTDQIKSNKAFAALISPAVSPMGKNLNPSVRYYTFNKDKLLDYDQFRLDLNSANQGSINWTKTYNFIKAYNSNISKEEIARVVVQIIKQPGLTIQYLSRLFSSIKLVAHPIRFLCLLTAWRSEQYSMCISSKNTMSAIVTPNQISGTFIAISTIISCIMFGLVVLLSMKIYQKFKKSPITKLNG